MLRAAVSLQPAIILLSATYTLDKGMFAAIAELSTNLAPTAPEIVLGGRAVHGQKATFGGATVLKAGLDEALVALETILVRKTHARPSR